MTERGHSEKMEYKRDGSKQLCAPNVRFFQHPGAKGIITPVRAIACKTAHMNCRTV